MTESMGIAIAIAYHVASRLAYVLYIGLALRRQERTGDFTRRYGAEEGFRRFRRVAAMVMSNDGLSFVALCFVSRNTLWFQPPHDLTVAAGIVLVVVGVFTKAWAGATLGHRAYYWSNFFEPESRTAPSSAGPYRFFKNPMYTIGYLPLYGIALLVQSLPGLVAAVFDQAAILTFYRSVEKPHFERSVGRAA
jgi:protein-S-isoprenylcysteine O-methyltransferase Ste14